MHGNVFGWCQEGPKEHEELPVITRTYGLKLVEAKYHSLIRETLEKQLQYEPEVKTRNRKPLRRPRAFKAE